MRPRNRVARNRPRHDVSPKIPKANPIGVAPRRGRGPDGRLGSIKRKVALPAMSSSFADREKHSRLHVDGSLQWVQVDLHPGKRPPAGQAGRWPFREMQVRCCTLNQFSRERPRQFRADIWHERVTGDDMSRWADFLSYRVRSIFEGATARRMARELHAERGKRSGNTSRTRDDRE